VVIVDAEEHSLDGVATRAEGNGRMAARAGKFIESYRTPNGKIGGLNDVCRGERCVAYAEPPSVAILEIRGA
jgi:hypothetical protein